MIIVDYNSKDGCFISDGNAEEWVNKLIDNCPSSGDTHVQVCSSLLIDCFRVAILEGRIDTNEIQFTFNGNILPHDSDGRMHEWPIGFSDVGDHILERLLAWKK